MKTHDTISTASSPPATSTNASSSSASSTTGSLSAATPATASSPSAASRDLARSRGFALLDALTAFAILGLFALGAARALDEGLRLAREAERLDRAREVAVRALSDLDLAGWYVLLERFAADAGDASATLHASVAEIPSGELRLTLEALGAGAASARFDEAVALRVRARVTWQERGRARSFELATVRT